MPSNDQRGGRGAGSRSGDDSRLIQIRFPEGVTAFVALSMAAGAALVACALLLQIGGQELEAIGSLLVGSGIGIILAAFGGQATTRGKGFVLAGSAAIALVLTAFLEYRRDAGVSNAAELARARARDYSRGSISGVPEPPTAISLVFGNTIAGSSNINRRDLFSFVVFGNEINQAATASLKIEGPDEENEVISIGIPMSCIAAGIGSDLPFDWQLRRPENGPMEIIDRRDSDRVLGRWGLDVPPPCEEVRQAATPGILDFAARLLGMTHAHAQEGNATASSALSQEDFDAIGTNLQSDRSDLRRAARNRLSAIEPEQVPAAIGLARNTDAPRVKLGVALALAEMLRRDRSQVERIRRTLADEDRDWLLGLAGDDHRATRIFATEFLYDLGDPQVTRMAIARAAAADGNGGDDARYNMIYVARHGWQHLDPEERASLQDDLDKAYSISGPDTQALFRSFAE